MNDERLWAPWRIGYISGAQRDAPPPEPAGWVAGADHACFLCRAAADYADDSAARRELLVVEMAADCVALLNRYPYNNGHLLVSPRRHVAELGDLTPDEHLAAMDMLARHMAAYKELIKAEGFNVGLNQGRVAGAGVPGHLHWHLVPRWAGDNNFMPVTGDVRVVSQSLEELWAAATGVAARQ